MPAVPGEFSPDRDWRSWYGGGGLGNLGSVYLCCLMQAEAYQVTGVMESNEIFS